LKISSHIFKNTRPGLREAAIWLVALVLLAWQPFGGTTMCGLHWLGFTHCPGCGIGTSIAHFLHGDFVASWHAHYLGMPAVFIIFTRIFHLLKSNIHFKNTRTP